MTVDVSLIRAYTNGLVAVTGYGVTNATPPVNASAGLNVAFNEIGAVSSDGITEATSQDRTDVFIWQGNTLARRIPGQFSKTFTVIAAETNLITLGVNYPGSTITQTVEGVTIDEKPPTTDVRQWVLHGIDGTRALRIYLPQAEVTNRGDVVWSSEDITVYEWELSAYVDSSGNVARRFYLDESLAL